MKCSRDDSWGLIQINQARALRETDNKGGNISYLEQATKNSADSLQGWPQTPNFCLHLIMCSGLNERRYADMDFECKSTSRNQINWFRVCSCGSRPAFRLSQLMRCYIEYQNRKPFAERENGTESEHKHKRMPHTLNTWFNQHVGLLVPHRGKTESVT